MAFSTRKIWILFCTSVFTLLTISTFAQKPADQTFKNDGAIITAKVLEITPTEIECKKF